MGGGVRPLIPAARPRQTVHQDIPLRGGQVFEPPNAAQPAPLLEFDAGLICRDFQPRRDSFGQMRADCDRDLSDFRLAGGQKGELWDSLVLAW